MDRVIPVFLHIGLMKTGTTSLQRMLRASVDHLAQERLTLLPANQVRAHRLALAVRGQPAEGRPGHSGQQVLARLARDVTRAPGDRCLLSAETLSFATAEQAGSLVQALGPSALPHVVVTVRDPARILPSLWQQRVKNGLATTLEDYLEQVRTGTGEAGTAFARSQHVGHVLEQWTSVVPAERLHVVVVPAAGNRTATLPERFCSVLGLDHTQLTATEWANESLGRVQVELLRRMNESLPLSLRKHAAHRGVVKTWFANDVLASQDGERVRLPSSAFGWVQELANDAVRAIEQSGAQVVGDLDELVPQPWADEPVVPVTDADVAAAAVDALTVVLERRAEQPTGDPPDTAAPAS